MTWESIGAVNRTLIAFLGIAIFIGIPAAAIHSAIRDARLYDHCITDGHKDYECHSMVRGGGHG